MTDQDLLRQFADEANSRPLDVFIQRHHGSILRFATRLIGDRSAARGVVEETFLRVAERPRRLLVVGSCRNCRRGERKRCQEPFSSRSAQHDEKRYCEKGS